MYSLGPRRCRPLAAPMSPCALRWVGAWRHHAQSAGRHLCNIASTLISLLCRLLVHDAGQGAACWWAYTSSDELSRPPFQRAASVGS